MTDQRDLLYEPIIRATASNFNLDPELLIAQVLIESSGDPFAFRYEPGFWTQYLVNRAPVQRPEGPLLACSYGLLQILGQTARERGYTGALPDLFDPAVGIRWGCEQLQYLRSRLPPETNYDIRALLASYNGGLGGNTHPPYRNAAYADKVLALRDQRKGTVSV